jgi:hypothetical protein
MPDLTMCLNKECPLADNCLRFCAPPDRLAQYYSDFAPDDEGNCEHYIPMDKEDFPSDYE